QNLPSDERFVGLHLVQPAGMRASAPPPVTVPFHRALARGFVAVNRLMLLEKLNLALVLLRGLARREGPEVSLLACRWIYLARVQPVLSVLELANHRALLFDPKCRQCVCCARFALAHRRCTEWSRRVRPRFRGQPSGYAFRSNRKLRSTRPGT